MHYIKFDTIESTNDFLKSYSRSNNLPNFFYVYTDLQTKGRGQHANTWQSECCKNILLSIFMRPEISLQNQNLLNQIVSLSIVKVLQKFNIPELKIKLPNDIMAGNKKIAGILIENAVYQNKWKQSIVGIGLNVNQTKFEDLPLATSMKILTNQHFDIEEIIPEIINNIKEYCTKNPVILSKEFNQLLYKKPYDVSHR